MDGSSCNNCDNIMSQQPAIILIASCTATKRGMQEEPIRLGALPRDIRARFRSWRDRIDSAHHRNPAWQAYGGDAWQHVLASREIPGQRRSALWVASAGLGLIASGEEIPNYSATFSPNHPDTVGQTPEQRILWWSLLADWRQERDLVHGIAQLARMYRDAVILVAVGSAYLQVLKTDLVEARTILDSPDQLMVLSAGAPACPPLGTSLLPVDARFEHMVGGARSTINARLMHHVLNRFHGDELRADVVARSLRSQARHLAPPRAFERCPLTDEAILRSIRGMAANRCGLSATRALQQLRGQGYACEQKRFRRLFEATITQPT